MHLTNNKQFDRTNVAIILMNAQYEILVAQRSYSKKIAPGLWHLPGGKLEEGEDIVDCIMRELSEEFGILSKDVVNISDIDYQFEYSIYDEQHRTIILKGEFIGAQNLQLNHETVQACFAKPNVVLEMIKENTDLYEQHLELFNKLKI
jgi:mutator protein MutT